MLQGHCTKLMTHSQLQYKCWHSCIYYACCVINPIDANAHFMACRHGKLMYDDGSVHRHCVVVHQRMQHAAQIEFGSIFAACCVALPSVSVWMEAMDGSTINYSKQHIILAYAVSCVDLHCCLYTRRHASTCVRVYRMRRRTAPYARFTQATQGLKHTSNLMQATSQAKIQPCHWPLVAYVVLHVLCVALGWKLRLMPGVNRGSMLNALTCYVQIKQCRVERHDGVLSRPTGSIYRL